MPLTPSMVVHVSPARGEAEIAAVRVLFKEYASSLPIDLEYQDFSFELQKLPGAYQPPHGDLLIARLGGVDAGCVAIRRIQENVCEMKRLFVRPPYRAAGVGSLLVDSAIAAARSLGYREMWLDTLPTMTAAHGLYTSRGFREIPSYGGPAAPGTRYYGLALAPGASLTVSQRF